MQITWGLSGIEGEYEITLISLKKKKQAQDRQGKTLYAELEQSQNQNWTRTS